MSAPILIIAWGNTGRRDDGVALRLADQLEQKLGDRTDVQVWQFHQLGPELACDLDRCRLAIFVDAHVHTDRPDVTVDRIEVAESASLNTHHCPPPGLLALTRAMGYRVPEAYQVCIRAYDMEFGDTLSPQTAAALLEAEQAVVRLVEDCGKAAQR